MQVCFLFSFSFFLLATSGLAQKIEACNHMAWAFISPGGTIANRHHTTTGYILKGTVQNASHATVGYIRTDGTVENASHHTIGYVKSDGTVENAAHRTIGHIRADGAVEDASHKTLAYAKNIQREWVAAFFFFFKSEFK